MNVLVSEIGERGRVAHRIPDDDPCGWLDWYTATVAGVLGDDVGSVVWWVVPVDEVRGIPPLMR